MPRTLSQFEVGVGVVPGGAPMARVSRLVGRGRALEILLVADDFDGPRAELYGYVPPVSEGDGARGSDVELLTGDVLVGRDDR